MSIFPGGTIGVLGSGQLGRMLAMAAHTLGYRVHVFSPDTDTPAGQAATREITASYDDVDALRAFASGVDVVTLEFENIPLGAIDVVERIVPVRPGRQVLATAQNRIVEKSTLRNAGLPVADHAAVRCSSDIVQFIEQCGDAGRVVLKSAEAGYDGIGQTIVEGTFDADAALSRIDTESAIVEKLIEFECELSVIGSRSDKGDVECFGPVLNRHRDHILDTSVAPAENLSPTVRAEAIEMTRTVLEQLDVCGVLCVELFYTTGGQLLINEIAPRPHNSGHLSIEAAVCSQFEQQVRAVCGLPLGSMQQVRPAAMANLLGQHVAGVTDWSSLLSWPTVKLHLYGKEDPRSRRKMGHLTATAANSAAAESQVLRARRDLMSNDSREQHDRDCPQYDLECEFHAD